MKKYKKKPTKLLQIRLSEKEHIEMIEFINKFVVTHREWLLTVKNYLKEANLIKDNMFWIDWKDYAYGNSSRWDKVIEDDSVCEKCGIGKYHPDKTKYHQLERHHHLGYRGENALKVQILCRGCHAIQPKCIDEKVNGLIL